MSSSETIRQAEQRKLAETGAENGAKALRPEGAGDAGAGAARGGSRRVAAGGGLAEPAPTAPVHHGGGLWVWVVIVCVVAAGIGGWYWMRQQTETRTKKAQVAAAQAAARPVPVVAAAAQKGDFPVYLKDPGIVTAYRTVTLRSRVDGQLVNVNFHEGDIVKAGQLLFQIDPRPFEVQVQQAQGQRDRDEASLVNAQQDLARYQRAAAAVSQQQIDTAQASVRQFQAAIKIDDATIASAKLQLVYCNITAPITGRIGLRLVDQGNMVHASDAGGLAVITQIQPITVIFSLPQQSLQQVMAGGRTGQGLPVDAFGLGGYTQLLESGKLEAIDSAIDPTTDMVKYKATFPNTKSRLYPNEGVNVRMLVDTMKGVTLVPAAAVQPGPEGAYVYIARRDATGSPAEGRARPSAGGAGRGGGRGGANAGPVYTVTLQAVEEGPSQGETTVITKGVKPGDMVVTDGVDKLENGTKVVLRKAGEVAADTGTAGLEEGGEAAAGAGTRAAGAAGAAATAAAGGDGRQGRGGTGTRGGNHAGGSGGSEP